MMTLLSPVLCGHSALFVFFVVFFLRGWLFYFFKGWAKLHLMSWPTIPLPDIDCDPAECLFFIYFYFFNFHNNLSEKKQVLRLSNIKSKN